MEFDGLRLLHAAHLVKFLPAADTVLMTAGDPLILKDMEKDGRLFDAPKFEHSYPHCWRCDTPLIYYIFSSQFPKRPLPMDSGIQLTVSLLRIRSSRTAVSRIYQDSRA